MTTNAASLYVVAQCGVIQSMVASDGESFLPMLRSDLKNKSYSEYLKTVIPLLKEGDTTWNEIGTNCPYDNKTGT